MSDLTDDISEEQLDVIGNLAESGALGATAWATRQLVREIRRHRSALAADRERVRSVEASEVYDTLEYHHNSGGQWVPKDFERLANAIATRAAEQLATGSVGLSESDRVRLRNIADLLRKQPVCWDMEAALLDRLIGASK